MCYPLNTYVTTHINRSSDETFDWHCDATLALSTIDFSVGLRWQTWQRVEHEEILLQRILVTAKPV